LLYNLTAPRFGAGLPSRANRQKTPLILDY
jgi:hypothetical protein